MDLIIPQINLSYKSQSQVARVITENWLAKNGYCPNCQNDYLTSFGNNKPVADFYCHSCLEEFELKSKASSVLGNKVVDGAYQTMLQRISSSNNPNFFFLTYNSSLLINNFILIPKHFFTDEIIQKRKPLSENARRAGWIGCNIEIGKVPEAGRIYFIKNEKLVPKQQVRKKWESGTFLRTKKGEAKGWILDVMKCVDKIHSEYFSLNEIYSFEGELAIKHPHNKHVRDKIRQQLQLLRDKNILEFLGNGKYRKVKP
jgi:type II restriction enzyme